jgi:hypothetical protein
LTQAAKDAGINPGAFGGGGSNPPKDPWEIIKNLRREVNTVRKGEVRTWRDKAKREESGRRGLEGAFRGATERNRSLMDEVARLRDAVREKNTPKTIMETLKSNAPKFLAGASVAAGLYGGHRLIQYIKHRHQADRNFESMMKSTPTLRHEDPSLVKSRFDTLQRFAPTIAHDPLVAGSVVRHWVEFPSVTADALRAVTSVERDVRKDPNLLNALGSLAGGFAGS